MSARRVREITPMLLDLLGMPRDAGTYRRAWRRTRIEAVRTPADEAVAKLQALGYIGNEPRWLLTRGRLRLENSDCSGALTDFRRATQLAPRDAIAFASCGTAALCEGDTAAAKRAFERSLELDSNQPQIRRALLELR